MHKVTFRNQVGYYIIDASGKVVLSSDRPEAILGVKAYDENMAELTGDAHAIVSHIYFTDGIESKIEIECDTHKKLNGILNFAEYVVYGVRSEIWITPFTAGQTIE